ncbi:MAG: response regulator transcription factor [Pseudohongiella sp.]|nr:response regulator transcription factor [Pseudohongiella sp.]MDO9522065.1 response regulator transcription factor [Pseudohongiella sp.]
MKNSTVFTNAVAKQMSITLVEDDELYGKILSYQLTSRGFKVLLCSSGKNLVDLLKNEEPSDLFILDYFLGDGELSGLDLCRKIRSYIRNPVIMLTGNNSLETLVSCLNSGADQYIVKPCDIKELIARIDATLRNSVVYRQSATSPLNIRVDENISLNWENSRLTHSDGRQVQLTEKEMGLLELFLKENNRFLDRRKAFQSLYGFEMDPLNRSIDVLVSKLRSRLRSLDDCYRIRTLRGQGYVMYRTTDSA